tara:strand:- start:57 stop:311 length:255 start_codon:yes stop_codon:yes gene_type:complete
MVALKCDTTRTTINVLTRRKTMTQYKDKVIARKLQLEEEAKDNQVIGIDTRIKDGKWTKQITTYASGRTVTEYADKRRKIVEEG